LLKKLIYVTFNFIRMINFLLLDYDFIIISYLIFTLAL